MIRQQQEPVLIERLREAIRTSGHSLHALGKSAGIDHGQLSRFLRGERNLSLVSAGRVCEALGLDLVEVAVKDTATSSVHSER